MKNIVIPSEKETQDGFFPLSCLKGMPTRVIASARDFARSRKQQSR